MRPTAPGGVGLRSGGVLPGWGLASWVWLGSCRGWDLPYWALDAVVGQPPGRWPVGRLRWGRGRGPSRACGGV
ncbi:MAG: hypothetical protein QW680_09145 [Pyrobaculum sp.]|uniref:hypothetical protein n=1 Tax=Pyrobaculum sp. TaxID=2004705 RepID=UPI003166F039